MIANKDPFERHSIKSFQAGPNLPCAIAVLTSSKNAESPLSPNN